MIAKKDVKTSLTKGKFYEVIRTEHSQIVIIDNQGFEIGYSLEFFDNKSFNQKDSYYYPLFEFMHDNYGLTLLDSEMQEIIHVVNKMFTDVK